MTKRTEPSILQNFDTEIAELIAKKMCIRDRHKTEEEAVAMIDPRNLDTLLHPQFDAAALKAATPMGKGLGASPGAACGKVVFTADDAEAWAARGEKVVLVRLETSPEDITGMKSAQGILTVRGGMTSHAAVVARGMGTCYVSGCPPGWVRHRKSDILPVRSDPSGRLLVDTTPGKTKVVVL